MRRTGRRKRSLRNFAAEPSTNATAAFSIPLRHCCESAGLYILDVPNVVEITRLRSYGTAKGGQSQRASIRCSFFSLAAWDERVRNCNAKDNPSTEEDRGVWGAQNWPA